MAATSDSMKSNPLMKGEGANPFVDPSGYKKYLAQKEQEFRTELANRNWPPSERRSERESRAATNFRTEIRSPTR